MVVFTCVLLSGEELGEVAIVQLSGSKWVASLWDPNPLSSVRGVACFFWSNLHFLRTGMYVSERNFEQVSQRLERFFSVVVWKGYSCYGFLRLHQKVSLLASIQTAVHSSTFESCLPCVLCQQWDWTGGKFQLWHFGTHLSWCTSWLLGVAITSFFRVLFISTSKVILNILVWPNFTGCGLSN